MSIHGRTIRILFLLVIAGAIVALDDPIPTQTSQQRGGPPPSTANMQALWPYNSLKPLSGNNWDKYYAVDFSEKHSSVSSGVAAGVTIAIFFMVFLFTFGCRIYSQYVDRAQEELSASRRSSRFPSEMVTADLWICGVPREPPPPYELAIHMPTHGPPPPAIV